MSTFSGLNCARDRVVTSPGLLQSFRWRKYNNHGELLVWVFGRADRPMEIRLRFSATISEDLLLRQSRGTFGIV